ncbi:hypothetical protein SADUNF_Sadunf05G0107400 [Salix dunnii]|uniref:Uncharacterized protein n=1 Tax=Salix dunnii TaxID=1413687 RepID=A0A835K7X3_9ROSI|nr:hypothetical protein SADUNF_Sadunf05G0107400 [Salix dunnii]
MNVIPYEGLQRVERLEPKIEWIQPLRNATFEAFHSQKMRFLKFRQCLISMQQDGDKGRKMMILYSPGKEVSDLSLLKFQYLLMENVKAKSFSHKLQG